jgi:hypothetical protein
MIVREREKTKRLLIGAACLFFVVAALVVVFAPTGKENLAYILGAALVIMALGAIGAAHFRFKLLGGIDVDTRTFERRIMLHGQRGKKASKDDDYPDKTLSC